MSLLDYRHACGNHGLLPIGAFDRFLIFQLKRTARLNSKPTGARFGHLAANFALTELWPQVHNGFCFGCLPSTQDIARGIRRAL